MLLIISLCVALSRFVWLRDGMPVTFVSGWHADTAEMMHTSQISYDVFCLAKVDFLQQVAHLQLHVLDHLANVGDVWGVVLDSHVCFYLAHHVAREVETTKSFAFGAEREDDGGCELVVGGAGAVLGIKYMDAVPAAGTGRCRGDGYPC
jgi:hypothetical protein